jgi:enoyl-CoA hydratase
MEAIIPQHLTIETTAPGVTLVTLNRPVKLNALSVALTCELADALDAARDDTGVRCVVLTGNERSFSAGADIADQQTYGADAVFGRKRLDAWDAIQNFPKPLVAAVNGYALGGGNELAMLTDIIIAGDTARFGQPEINIGILPGDGATQRLVRAVGKAAAMKMILTGEMIDAEAALRMGLVAEVVPAAQTLARAIEIAARIAEKSPIAAKLAKEAVLMAFETSLASGLNFERRNLRTAFDSADRKEGMAAFLEKRKPVFRGI